MKAVGPLSGAALVLFLSVAVCASEANPVLSNGDCIKCHPVPSLDLAAEGAAHRQVDCKGCHPGHQPKSPFNIPLCSRCHQGEPHFEQDMCQQCHISPHTPLKVVMPRNSNKPCTACHAAQVAQIERVASAHSTMFCSMCHEVHRQVPRCLDCHDSHREGGELDTCGHCHRAHMPVPVTYGYDIPNEECGACHREAYTLLSGSKARHNSRSCAYCHQRKHGSIVECRSCHGEPHRLNTHARFAECSECHNIAHDLTGFDSPDRHQSRRNTR